MMGDDELDSGTRRLVEDLLAKEPGPERDEILRRVRAFEYHEFRTEHDLPLTLLRERLLGARFDDLAENVVDGKYDQDAEEARKWVLGNGEGPAMESISAIISTFIDGVIEPVIGTPEFAPVMSSLVQSVSGSLGWLIAQHCDSGRVVDAMLAEIDNGVAAYTNQHRDACRNPGCDVETVATNTRSLLQSMRVHVSGQRLHGKSRGDIN